jgi:UPF0716 protein FxsA
VKLRYVPLAVIILGAVEFFVLIGMAKLITLPGAVLGLIALSLVGAFLVKSEGLRAWRRLQAVRQTGDRAGDEVLNGVVGLGAALLLAVPGYLTALAGLILFLPPMRRLARGRLRRATERRVRPGTANDLFGPRQVRVTTKHPPKSGDGTSEDVIEGEIVD